MSPVPSRYIRAIYLLPGVKGGSEAKRAKGASQAAEKEDNCCNHVVLYRCFTVVSWGHGGQKKKKKKKCMVVLYFSGLW